MSQGSGESQGSCVSCATLAALDAERDRLLGSLAFLLTREDMPEVLRGYCVNVINDTPHRADSIPERADQCIVAVAAHLKNKEAARLAAKE